MLGTVSVHFRTVTVNNSTLDERPATLAFTGVSTANLLIWGLILIAGGRASALTDRRRSVSRTEIPAAG